MFGYCNSKTKTNIIFSAETVIHHQCISTQISVYTTIARNDTGICNMKQLQQKHNDYFNNKKILSVVDSPLLHKDFSVKQHLHTFRPVFKYSIMDSGQTPTLSKGTHYFSEYAVVHKNMQEQPEADWGRSYYRKDIQSIHQITRQTKKPFVCTFSSIYALKYIVSTQHDYIMVITGF